MNAAEQVLHQALALDRTAREEIGLRLLHSVAPGSDRTEDEWRAEIDRRAQEVLDGVGESSPWPEARERIEAKIRALESRAR
jgi:putative addiction module component (TIGR02574 family)